ncbi:MAG: hydroxyacylglutathione hydrolase [Comamonadaceae bacterium]|nr:MAG: hydroxyacylglutathione hydrolase [Comamonadaceae bacterium]
MPYLIPIPAFADNYLWVLHDGKRALVVDPGDAAPVVQVLEKLGLQLESILVTHHHADHTGGVDALRERTGAVVFGPATERIPKPFTPLREGDTAHALGIDFQVIDVPGHTAGHIAFYAPAVSIVLRDTDGSEKTVDPSADHFSDVPGPRPVLFCGDTLFSGGCGRLFEGTPAQMLDSLDKLAALPDSTLVCCAHEYTLSNLRFAEAVDTDNQDLRAWHAKCIALREAGQPTVPSFIAQERLVNPFLRSRLPAVQDAARRFDPQATDDISVFAAIRQWKNQFK